MPREWRYVLRRDFPRVVRFRGGEPVIIEIGRPSESWIYKWELRARRVDGVGVVVHICGSPYSRSHLERVMFAEGFILERGAPAARLVNALQRAGHVGVNLVKY